VRFLLIAALGGLVCGDALAGDAPVPLKPWAGADVVGAACGVCHTSDYIVMNSKFLTQDGWRAEVTKMRTAFGAAIDDATAAEIVAYLAAHYAVAGQSGGDKEGEGALPPRPPAKAEPLQSIH
jgi:mono/diheme cytochrome c family protein